FSLGMGKKILLANPMAYVADRAFGADVLRWHDGWFGLVAYAFQIYFDFSAYSDMAVGLGLMLGFLLIKNFDDPYRADSISDLCRPLRRAHLRRPRAPLALPALHVAARLPVPAAGRQSPRPFAHLRQPAARDAAGRPVARRVVDLRRVGRDPRHVAGSRAGSR